MLDRCPEGKENISEKQAAYTAGFVDGEGSIQINMTKREGHTYWALLIQVSNCRGDILQELQREWGIGTVTSWQPKGNARLAYNWRICSAQSSWFLRTIQPYLRVKAKHAEVALAFRELTCRLGHHLSQEQLAEQRRLATMMHTLNSETVRTPSQEKWDAP